MPVTKVSAFWSARRYDSCAWATHWFGIMVVMYSDQIRPIVVHLDLDQRLERLVGGLTIYRLSGFPACGIRFASRAIFQRAPSFRNTLSTCPSVVILSPPAFGETVTRKCDEA